MYLKKLAVALSAILTLSNVNAKPTSTANFGGPDAVDNQIKTDKSQREPDFKTSLEKQGINIGLDYSAVYMRANSVPSGAEQSASSDMVRFYGSWDAINRDNNNTGGMVWKVEYRHAYDSYAVKDFEFGVGGLGLVTPPFSDEGLRLTNLYWKQKFANGDGTLVAGFLDVTDFVDVFAMASPWTGFMNFAFSTGTTTMALPGDATLGMAAGYMLTDELYMIGSVADMNSDPTKPFDGFDSLFNEHKLFKSLELGWTQSKDHIYVDNIHLTYWHADDSEAQGTNKSQGLNFSASRLINNQWLPFFRAGYSEGEDDMAVGSLMEKSVSAGVGYYGLGGPKNNLGFAVNWGDVKGADDQYTTELFYIMNILPFLEVTADVQHLANPTLRPDKNSALMYGLRMRVAM